MRLAPSSNLRMRNSNSRESTSNHRRGILVVNIQATEAEVPRHPFLAGHSQHRRTRHRFRGKRSGPENNFALVSSSASAHCCSRSVGRRWPALDWLQRPDPGPDSEVVRTEFPRADFGCRYSGCCFYCNL
jgi:hypothetical protein